MPWSVGLAQRHGVTLSALYESPNQPIRSIRDSLWTYVRTANSVKLQIVVKMCLAWQQMFLMSQKSLKEALWRHHKVILRTGLRDSTIIQASDVVKMCEAFLQILDDSNKLFL